MRTSLEDYPTLNGPIKVSCVLVGFDKRRATCKSVKIIKHRIITIIGEHRIYSENIG